MKNKICIITGATSGIGLVTARALSKMGAILGIVGRTKEKAIKAKQDIVSYSQNQDVTIFCADLSSQQQIRALGEEITNRFDHVDVLINNAAAIFVNHTLSEDNIEMQFATNHLSYFLLTHLLLGHLHKSDEGRIINVSSNGHFRGHINFDDLYHKKNYQGFKVYAASKLANVMFTYHLAKKLKKSKITVNALHPGVVKTRIGNKHTKWWMGMLWFLVSRIGIKEDEGAKTSIYLASSPEVKGVTGQYFYKNKAGKSSEESHNVEYSEKLWEVSTKLCKLNDINAPLIS